MDTVLVHGSAAAARCCCCGTKRTFLGWGRKRVHGSSVQEVGERRWERSAHGSSFPPARVLFTRTLISDRSHREVRVLWGERETRENCYYALSLLRFVLVWWRGTPTPEQCGCPPPTPVLSRALTLYLFMCALCVRLLIITVTLETTDKEDDGDSGQFKAPVCVEAFKKKTRDVSFVLRAVGGALWNRAPVWVKGEVLHQWEAERKRASYLLYIVI